MRYWPSSKAYIEYVQIESTFLFRYSYFEVLASCSLSTERKAFDTEFNKACHILSAENV